MGGGGHFWQVYANFAHQSPSVKSSFFTMCALGGWVDGEVEARLGDSTGQQVYRKQSFFSFPQ